MTSDNLKRSDNRWLTAKINRWLNQLSKTTLKADHLLDTETKIVKRYQILTEHLTDDRLPKIATIQKIDSKYQLQNQQQTVIVPQSLLNVVSRNNRQPETLCWLIVDDEPVILTVNWLKTNIKPVLQQHLAILTNDHQTAELVSDDGIYLPSSVDSERDW